MSLRVQKLPAAAGLMWIRAGFTLFFSQFLGIVMLLMTYLFGAFLVAFVVDGLGRLSTLAGFDGTAMTRMGGLAFAALSPAITVGILEACRAAAARQPINPLFLIKGFQLGQRGLLSLLGLGIFQVAAFTVMFSLVPDMNPAVTLGPNASDPNLAANSHLSVASLVTVSASLLITLVLWYAPVLAAWHGMRALKAMFYSVAACWRNRTAFILFGIGWLTIIMVALELLGVLQSVIGPGGQVILFAGPAALVLIGAMYCSVYATYASVFISTEDDAAPLGSTAPEPPAPPNGA